MTEPEQTTVPPVVVSATRTAVQMLWAALITLGLRWGLPLPEAGPWLDGAVLLVVGWAWTALVRRLETAENVWARRAGRLLMLMIRTQPAGYVKP